MTVELNYQELRALQSACLSRLERLDEMMAEARKARLFTTAISMIKEDRKPLASALDKINVALRHRTGE